MTKLRMSDFNKLQMHEEGEHSLGPDVHRVEEPAACAFGARSLQQRSAWNHQHKLDLGIWKAISV